MRAPRGVNNSPWQCCLPKLKLSWVLDVLTCPSHRSSIRTSCCRVWQNFQHCFLKALLCRDKKRVRRFTCSVRILSWCYVLCSHFSKLFPAGLTSVLSQGFYLYCMREPEAVVFSFSHPLAGREVGMCWTWSWVSKWQWRWLTSGQFKRGESWGGPGRRQCLYLRLHKWSDFQRSWGLTFKQKVLGVPAAEMPRHPQAAKYQNKTTTNPKCLLTSVPKL